MRYEKYLKPMCYEAQYADRTCGSFALISRRIGNEPHLLIKQRNGKGSCPFQYDLPGGRLDPDKDLSSLDTCRREVREETGFEIIPMCFSRVGDPLFLQIKDEKSGLLNRVDVATYFLVKDFSEDKEPQLSEESLDFKFVNRNTVLEFDVVGLDKENGSLGRTPVMIFDGLSVMDAPFKRISLKEAEQLLFGEGKSSLCGYFLLDDGNYFGRVVKKVKKNDPDEVEVYYRLNPFEPNGKFKGQLG